MTDDDFPIKSGMFKGMTKRDFERAWKYSTLMNAHLKEAAQDAAEDRRWDAMSTKEKEDELVRLRREGQELQRLYEESLAETRATIGRHYLSSASPEEILLSLRTRIGRRGLRTALSRPGADKLHDNDYWRVWIVVERRRAVTGEHLSTAFRAIARNGGCPKQDQGRAKAEYDTAPKLKSIYYRAKRWIESDVTRTENSKELLAIHLAEWKKSGQTFGAFEKAALRRQLEYVRQRR